MTIILSLIAGAGIGFFAGMNWILYKQKNGALLTQTSYPRPVPQSNTVPINSIFEKKNPGEGKVMRYKKDDEAS